MSTEWEIAYGIATVRRNHERWDVEVTTEGVEVELDDSYPYGGGSWRVTIPHAVLDALRTQAKENES